MIWCRWLIIDKEKDLHACHIVCHNETLKSGRTLDIVIIFAQSFLHPDLWYVSALTYPAFYSLGHFFHLLPCCGHAVSQLGSTGGAWWLGVVEASSDAPDQLDEMGSQEDCEPLFRVMFHWPEVPQAQFGVTVWIL